ncbi:MAG: ribonuclease T [Pseudomonadota bacterium]|nr:ribonuclease T [Pseudomonadota bacterium]
MAERFRGFLPVVVDVETAGFNAQSDALLEVAAVIVGFDQGGRLRPTRTLSYHLQPFEGANLDPAALEFNGIDPHHPLRIAHKEQEAIPELLREVRAAVRAAECKRAVLVGHNANFDLSFLQAAIERCNIKRNPFHPFSTFDTVSLAALAFGQTVLARACASAGIEFDNAEAHSARYDTEKTAELFCAVVNRWAALEASGGL